MHEHGRELEDILKLTPQQLVSIYGTLQRRKKREDRALYGLIRNAVAAGMGSKDADKNALESLK